MEGFVYNIDQTGKTYSFSTLTVDDIVNIEVSMWAGPFFGKGFKIISDLMHMIDQGESENTYIVATGKHTQDGRILVQPFVTGREFNYDNPRYRTDPRSYLRNISIREVAEETGILIQHDSIILRNSKTRATGYIDVNRATACAVTRNFVERSRRVKQCENELRLMGVKPLRIGIVLYGSEDRIRFFIEGSLRVNGFYDMLSWDGIACIFLIKLKHALRLIIDATGRRLYDGCFESSII